jgi:hypothetical protein
MLDNIISGIKEREWKFSIPILKVCKHFKDRDKPKPKVEYEWVYDGCNCVPKKNIYLTLIVKNIITL